MSQRTPSTWRRAAERAVRREAMLSAAGRGLLVTAALVLSYELTARFLPLPSARLALGLSMIIGAAGAMLWSATRRPDPAAVRRRAAADLSQPSLWLASEAASPSRLAPLLAHRTHAALEASAASPRARVDASLRRGAGAAIVAFLILALPGRTPSPALLGADLADTTAQEARTTLDLLADTPLPRPAATRLREALKPLTEEAAETGDVERALALARAARNETRSGLDAAADALERGGLTRELARALRRGDLSRIDAALDTLAQELARHPAADARRKEAQEALDLAARALEAGEARDALRAAAGALAGGGTIDREQLGRALLPLARLQDELAAVVVTFESVLERAGISRSEVMGEAGPALEDAVPEVKAPSAAVRARFDATPRQRIILQRYFDR